MRNKKSIWFFLIAGGCILIFLFRLQIINKIELYQIHAAGNGASLSNTMFSPKGDAIKDHQIYTLKGIERIIPHRVNSLRRLEYLYHDFKGFECDIIFDNKDSVLYLAHDVEEISSHTFETFLKADKEKKIFWLDVKNLDSNNFGSFFAHLSALNKRYDLKRRIIVESSNPFFLPQLVDSGYLTSLYFSADNGNEHECFVSCIEREGCLISQDVSFLNMLNQAYPQKKKIIWDITFLHSLNVNMLTQHMQDSSILLCLINIKSPGYR